MGQPDTYILKAVIETPRIKARVYSPVLTEEERARRMKQIAKSAENLVKSVLVQKSN